LRRSPINGVKYRRITDLWPREVPEEEVEVALQVSLRGVLDDAETVPRVGTEPRREEVQCAQTVGGDPSIAGTQAVQETKNVDLRPGLGQRPGHGRPDLLGDFGLHRVSYGGCRGRVGALLLGLGLGLGHWLSSWESNSFVEVNGWRDEVDVLFDVRRNAVSTAAEVRLTGHVHVNMKLGLQ